MKYAILSDVHANLEAFQTVLDKCRELDVSSFVFLGDIVGYNANPRECLSLLRSLNVIAAVKGNHDEYASNGDEIMEGFNPHAREAVLWTQHQLTDDDKIFLQGLPMVSRIRGTQMTIVHATMDGPGAWGYIYDIHQAIDNFSYQSTQLCFCGHSHVPVTFCRKPFTMSKERLVEELKFWAAKDEELVMGFNSDLADEIVLPIEPGCKYLINVGSVGQPRNRDPRASFAVYDSEAGIVTRYRLPYDLSVTQQKIRDCGLPERLATRLEHGM